MRLHLNAGRSVNTDALGKLVPLGIGLLTDLAVVERNLVQHQKREAIEAPIEQTESRMNKTCQASQQIPPQQILSS